jgi:hypothetical protein
VSKRLEMDCKSASVSVLPRRCGCLKNIVFTMVVNFSVFKHCFRHANTIRNIAILSAKAVRKSVSKIVMVLMRETHSRNNQPSEYPTFVHKVLEACDVLSR